MNMKSKLIKSARRLLFVITIFCVAWMGASKSHAQDQSNSASSLRDRILSAKGIGTQLPRSIAGATQSTENEDEDDAVENNNIQVPPGYNLAGARGALRSTNRGKMKPNIPPVRLVAWLLVEGRFEEASEQADASLRVASHDDWRSRAELMTLKGAALWLSHKGEESVDVLAKAGQLARAAHAPSLIIRAATLQSLIMQSKKPIDNAMVWSESLTTAMTISDNDESSISLARALNLAGLGYKKTGKITCAIDALENAEKVLPKSAASNLDRIVCLYNLGTLDVSMAAISENPVETMSRGEKSLEKARMLCDSVFVGVPLRAALDLHLACVADSRDDAIACSRYCLAFSNLVVSVPTSQQATLMELEEAFFSVVASGTGSNKVVAINSEAEFSNRERKEFQAEEGDGTDDNFDLLRSQCSHERERGIKAFLVAIARAEDWADKFGKSAVDEQNSQIEPFRRMGMSEETIKAYTEKRRQLDETMKVRMEEMVRSGRAKLGLSDFKLDKILAQLPAPGRRVSKNDAFDSLGATSIESVRPEIKNALSQLYDLDRIPATMLTMLCVLGRPRSAEELNMNAMGIEMTGASTIASFVISKLHALKFDRPIWQLSELSASLNFHGKEFD